MGIAVAGVSGSALAVEPGDSSAPPPAPAPGESAASAAPPAGEARAARPPYPYPPYPYAYPGVPLTPPTLPYREDLPIPPNYRLDERSNKPLIITGLSLFGLAYGISLGVSTIVLSGGGSKNEEFAPLLIPVVGPFITMGTLENASATLALDGVTQSVGMLSLLIGIFATEKVLVRENPPASAMAPDVLVGPGSASLRWQF